MVGRSVRGIRRSIRSVSVFVNFPVWFSVKIGISFVLGKLTKRVNVGCFRKMYVFFRVMKKI